MARWVQMELSVATVTRPDTEFPRSQLVNLGGPCSLGLRVLAIHAKRSHPWDQHSARTRRQHMQKLHRSLWKQGQAGQKKSSPKGDKRPRSAETGDIVIVS